MARTEPEYKRRYREAYEENFKAKYPTAFKDLGFPEMKWPKVKTANGLTLFITNFLNWSGHRATRINVQGKMIEGVERQESGLLLRVKKFGHSTTRKGTADISATIKGRAVMIEIKAGKDKPSDKQLLEQQRERMAGGIYEFVYDAEEFFTLYDRLMSQFV